MAHRSVVWLVDSRHEVVRLKSRRAMAEAKLMSPAPCSVRTSGLTATPPSAWAVFTVAMCSQGGAGLRGSLPRNWRARLALDDCRGRQLHTLHLASPAGCCSSAPLRCAAQSRTLLCGARWDRDGQSDCCSYSHDGAQSWISLLAAQVPVLEGAVGRKRAADLERGLFLWKLLFDSITPQLPR